MTGRANSNEMRTLLIVSCGGRAEGLAGLTDSIGPLSKVILLDPDEGALGNLPEFLLGGAVTHIRSLPAATTGQAEAIAYSLPGLVSLNSPTDALKSLYPGLKERNRRPVDLMSSVDLSSELGELRDRLVCVIDLPGSEVQILDALGGAGLLENSTEVRVRCGVEAFFENSIDSQAMTEELVQRGFYFGAMASDDPDWPVLTYFADPRARLVENLESDLVALNDELSKRAARIDDITRTLTETQGVLERASEEKATLQDQLRGMSAEIESSQKVISDRDQELIELRKQIDGIRGDFENGATALKNLEETLKDKETKLTELVQTVSLKDQEIETLGARLADADRALQETSHIRDAREAELAEARAMMEERGKALEKANLATNERDAQLAEKEHILAEKEVELAALREELSGSETARNDQVKTTEDITGKLTEANASIAALEQSVASRDTMLVASNEQIQALEYKRSEVEAALKAAEQRVEQFSADQAFQVRVNAMMQVDLDNLRSRFEASETQRRRQEELLRKLTPKLALAAEHLHLVNASPTHETPVLEEEEEPAKSPRKTSTPRRRSTSRSKKVQ